MSRKQVKARVKAIHGARRVNEIARLRTAIVDAVSALDFELLTPDDIYASHIENIAWLLKAALRADLTSRQKQPLIAP